jgi:hypothetical protein
VIENFKADFEFNNLTVQCVNVKILNTTLSLTLGLVYAVNVKILNAGLFITPIVKVLS